MALALWLCESWGAHQKNSDICQHLYLKESCSPVSGPNSVLSWRSSSCNFSSSRAQRELVYVHLCIDPLWGTAWVSTSCPFHSASIPLYFTDRNYENFPPGTLALGSGMWLRHLASHGGPLLQDILPNFYLPYMGVWSACPASLPLIPVWMWLFL